MGKAGGFLQGVAAEGNKFVRVVGVIDHIGELLHLAGPQHGDHRLSGGQILVEPGGDHIVIGPVLPEQVQQHIAAVQPVGHLGGRSGAGQKDVGQLVQPVEKRIFTFYRTQQEKAPVGPGLSGQKHRGQVQPRPGSAAPAEDGGGHAGEGVRPGSRGLEQGEVDAVGQQGDVGAARGQPVGQLGGGGKDHIGRLGQAPLPVGRQSVPCLVAVVDQRAEFQPVQQMDVAGVGGPQQRFGKALPCGDILNELAYMVPGQPEQEPVPL